MLDKRDLIRTEGRLIGHMSFPPQEMVQCEIWIGGLQRRHNYKQQFPRGEM